MKLAKTLLILLLCTVPLVGCTQKLRDTFTPGNGDPIDRRENLQRDDYLNMSRPMLDPEGDGPTVKVEKGAPPIPGISHVLAAPRPPKIGEDQLVSIAVTDDVPLKDVLLELARLADVDVELDSGIEGGISFIAKEKPFNEVIDRIANLAGLRYTMRGGVLRVERDVPYIKSYSLDFLNVDRSSESSVNISTNVLSGAGGGGDSGGDGGGGLNTGSTSTITASTEGDFWQSLDSGIQQILSYRPARRVSNPIVWSTEEDATEGVTRQVATTESEEDTDAVETFYILNRQAGLLTISATDQQQHLIDLYIKRIRSSASAQVLIEAKIVEVALDDRYQSGVNWSALNDKLGLGINFPSGGLTDVTTFTLNDGILGGLSGVVQLTETFGTTRTLSSPRLHAINNQQAVLTFAENLVYFDISVERETDTTSSTNQELLTVDSEVKTVPIGIILTMQPSVNLEKNEVTLSVRPTLSRVTGTVSDPAVAFLASQGGVNISNEVPVVEVRELDSILKLKSGEVMVIGGLMEQQGDNQERGVPFISGVPWLGNLFKAKEQTNQTTELIIFIKATIVSPTGSTHEADEIIYNKFTTDPRPLAF